MSLLRTLTNTAGYLEEDRVMGKDSTTPRNKISSPFIQRFGSIEYVATNTTEPLGALMVSKSLTLVPINSLIWMWTVC